MFPGRKRSLRNGTDFPVKSVGRHVWFHTQKRILHLRTGKTNNQEINVLDSLLEERINSRYITALNVVTFVSPDGDSVYNAALSVRRNNSMREFLRQRYPYVDVEKIKLTSEGEDWSELRKLVASDSDLPDREEVLMLIDYHRDNIVKRKELLQKLNQGMAFNCFQYKFYHPPYGIKSLKVAQASS